MPATCTKEDCPYICDEFVTPNGIDIDEMLSKAQSKKESSGFLSMISEDLKVIYSKSSESITPETIATNLDTHVEAAEEMIMTEDEKILREEEPVTLMIEEMEEDFIEEEVEEEKEVAAVEIAEERYE
jgi:hypothetical protein